MLIRSRWWLIDSNLKKGHGFTLIEVVISIAIISVISLGLYNAYLLLIKQTKDGQVRQTASLEGKRVIEEIKSTIENDGFQIVGSTLSFGEMNFKDIGGTYTRYLDENYNDIDRELYKYTETITIEKTKTEQDGSVVLEEDLATDETTNPLNINYKVYIGEEKNNNTIEDYITDQIDKTGKKYLGSDSGKIILYIYFEQNPNSEDYRIDRKSVV